MATWKSHYRCSSVFHRDGKLTLFAYLRASVPQISRRGNCLRAFSLLALFALASGCHKPAPPQGPTAEFIQHDDVDPLWQAAQSVLRKHDFQIDRRDLAAGVIETLPTTSQHFSEFWRQDVADPYSFAQATMHTMQRKAIVRFIRAAGSQWSFEVEVDVYRLSTPEHQVTSASSALLAFSGGLPTATGQVGVNASKQREWVPLGRDGELESRLLSQIFKAAGRTPVAMQDGGYVAPVQPGYSPAPANPPPQQPTPRPTPQPRAAEPIESDGALIPLR